MQDTIFDDIFMPLSRHVASDWQNAGALANRQARGIVNSAANRGNASPAALAMGASMATAQQRAALAQQRAGAMQAARQADQARAGQMIGGLLGTAGTIGAMLIPGGQAAAPLAGAAGNALGGAIGGGITGGGEGAAQGAQQGLGQALGGATAPLTQDQGMDFRAASEPWNPLSGGGLFPPASPGPMSIEDQAGRMQVPPLPTGMPAGSEQALQDTVPLPPQVEQNVDQAAAILGPSLPALQGIQVPGMNPGTAQQALAPTAPPAPLPAPAVPPPGVPGPVGGSGTLPPFLGTMLGRHQRQNQQAENQLYRTFRDRGNADPTPRSVDVPESEMDAFYRRLARLRTQSGGL